MEKDYEIRDERLLFYMPEELDQHCAEALCKRLDFLIDAYGVRHLILDFRKTEFMDSSGIGLMIGRSRKLGFLGGTVHAAHLSGRMKKIVLASGLQKIVKMNEEEYEENE